LESRVRPRIARWASWNDTRTRVKKKKAIEKKPIIVVKERWGEKKREFRL